MESLRRMPATVSEPTRVQWESREERTVGAESQRDHGRDPTCTPRTPADLNSRQSDGHDPRGPCERAEPKTRRRPQRGRRKTTPDSRGKPANRPLAGRQTRWGPTTGVHPVHAEFSTDTHTPPDKTPQQDRRKTRAKQTLPAKPEPGARGRTS